MDGVIPLGKLAEVLKQVEEAGDKHKLKVANIFHAGDGNLHPLILYNANDEREKVVAEECGAEILEAVRGCGRLSDRRAWRWTSKSGISCAISIRKPTLFSRCGSRRPSIRNGS